MKGCDCASARGIDEGKSRELVPRDALVTGLSRCSSFWAGIAYAEG